MPQTHDKDRITIYDVAEEAGVAISTVSRVLNHSPDVSEATKKKVQDVIDKLKFQPDRTAKSLAKRSTLTLAIAIPTFTTPFHNELLKGVRSQLQAVTGDSDLLLCDLGADNPQEVLLSFLSRGTVDGLLLAGVPVTVALFEKLQRLHAPVVLVGHDHSEIDCFHWDNREGAELAVDHLVERGHRRIGLIRSHTDGHLQLQRIEGFKAGLEKAGIAYDETLVRSGKTSKHAGFSEENGYEAMLELLEIEPAVTAVFASSDVQAIGAMKAINEAGKRVPEDIAVIGYDDIKTSYYIGLSSIDQRMMDVGERATEVLMRRVEGSLDEPPIDVTIHPTLHARRSTDIHRED